MIKMYYGRENVDKAKFIFDSAGTKSIVLVPDQFTLEAEREALRCLGADGIMDLEILSISRLGFRMLSEVGGLKKSRIDKYGRHIVLTSVIEELGEKGELEAYGRIAGKASFVELVNNFISGLKQHGVKPEDLGAIRKTMSYAKREILARKLDDIEKIFTKYEEKISGRFVDTEDYIDLYIPAVQSASIVRGREIWMWGFDSFAPKNAELIKALMQVADVNLVMTSAFAGRDSEIFVLTRNVMRMFEETASELGVPCEKLEIPADCRACDSAANVLEQELFAIPPRPVSVKAGGAGVPGGEASDAEERANSQLTLVAAANYYSEAETAAAYIKQLVRDKDLKYKDILVVCNDLAGRAEIIKRVFAEYDMEIFTDEKGGILHEPLVIYVLSLIEIMTKGYRSKDIISFLKTGLTPIDKGRVEELENYTIKYRIQGASWKKPFEYGVTEYGEEEFAALEKTRAEIIALIDDFEEGFKESRLAESRAEALYKFLVSEEGPAALIAGEQPSASEGNNLSQIWDAVMVILDQIVNISGGEKVSMETFGELLEAGFAAVEVGRIPPTADGLVLGTMQRTRSGRVKALVVLGANEGLLPKEKADEELLSEEEKEALGSAGYDICTLDKLRMQEERIAIYRALSRPTDYLYMSYSGSDGDGNELKPSRIFNTVKRIFPDVEIQADLDNRNNPTALFEGKNSALNHLVRKVRETAEISEEKKGDTEAEAWQTLAGWYAANDREGFDRATEGLFYTNRTERLRKDVVDALYRSDVRANTVGAEGRETDNIGDLTLSPSRLEKYSRCPFAHFVNYGLRPDERRVFEAAAREIGDIYHECLMIFSQRLAERVSVDLSSIAGFDTGMELSFDPENTMRWNTISRAESDKLIEEIIAEQVSLYKEGLMQSGEEEAYRKSRMDETLKAVAWALVLQARAGDIRDMYFEEGFGRNASKTFPAIIVDTSAGEVYIEGKIDRVDILANGAVKIIDYKSGNEKWNTDEARTGWRLQLMLYLKAATAGERSSVKEDNHDAHGAVIPNREAANVSLPQAVTREPAGIFYFLIKDAEISADGMDENALKDKISEGFAKEFKMNGLAVDSFTNVENIERNMEGMSQVVTGLRKLKEAKEDGRIYSGAVMTRDEFAELQTAFDAKITELCEALANGEVAARPKRIKENTACRFCSYKSICKFDAALPGCDYEKIL